MGYPPQPPGGYYPPQPGYPPQQPAQGYPPQQYGPPQPPAPGYPPPGPVPQAQFQAPPPQASVPVRATLEEYMEQPSGGGGQATSKYFTKYRPQGSWLQFTITRDLTNADVQQQTDNNGTPMFFKTGNAPDPTKPKLVLILQGTVVQADDAAGSQAAFPDGALSLWLKGITRDSFVAAMAQAGVPDADRALGRGKLGGAVVTMVSAGTRPSNKPGMNDTNLFNFTYQPGGREHITDPTSAQATAPATQTAPAVPAAPTAPAPPAAAPVAAPQAPPAPPAATPPAPAAPPASPPQPTFLGYDAQGQPVWDYSQVQQAAPAAPAAPAPPAPPAAPAGPPPPPGGYAQAPVPPAAPPAAPMDAEKAALLARLQGQG